MGCENVSPPAPASVVCWRPAMPLPSALGYPLSGLSSPFPALRPPLPCPDPPWSPSHQCWAVRVGGSVPLPTVSLHACYMTGFWGSGIINQLWPLTEHCYIATTELVPYVILLLLPFYWWAQKWSSPGQTAKWQSRDFNPDPSHHIEYNCFMVTRSSVCASDNGVLLKTEKL